MPVELHSFYVMTKEQKAKRKNAMLMIKLSIKQMILLEDPDKEKLLRKIYDEVNDKRLVVDDSPSRAYYYMGWTVVLLALFIALIGLLQGKFFMWEVFFFVPALPFFIYAYTAPKKFLIFDREKGLLTFPGILYFKSKTFLFSESRVGWSQIGGMASTRSVLVMGDPNSYTGGSVVLQDGRFKGVWSFLLWYMDKNRPLPPGDAFDAYRERDFQRRKAEGFPPPLYKSTFPTPEATPEQQAERERYWRDEDHYGESFSRWY